MAKAEYDVNKKANNDVPDSVPQVQLNELFLKCKETELAIEKARLDRRVAAEEAKVAAAEVEAAKVMVDRHKSSRRSPAWWSTSAPTRAKSVQPYAARDPRRQLDSLWVEGHVPAAKFARSELEGRDVTVDVVITRDGHAIVPGKVIFVNPLTDTGDSYMVRAKVENVKVGNGSWLLSPGMQAEMHIQAPLTPTYRGFTSSATVCFPVPHARCRSGGGPT